jgi:hypothetical protein
MNDKLFSILRHWITALLTAFTLWIVGILTLDAEHQKMLTDAAGQLVTPLVTILGLVAVAVWRLALTWISQLFRHGSGEQGVNDSSSGGTALILLIGTAAVLGGLPSCSPSLVEAARAVPIKGTLHTDHGDLSYSSKSGLEIEVDATSGK